MISSGHLTTEDPSVNNVLKVVVFKTSLTPHRLSSTQSPSLLLQANICNTCNTPPKKKKKMAEWDPDNPPWKAWFGDDWKTPPPTRPPTAEEEAAQRELDASDVVPEVRVFHITHQIIYILNHFKNHVRTSSWNPLFNHSSPLNNASPSYGSGLPRGGCTRDRWRTWRR